MAIWGLWEEDSVLRRKNGPEVGRCLPSLRTSKEDQGRDGELRPARQPAGGAGFGFGSD